MKGLPVAINPNHPGPCVHHTVYGAHLEGPEVFNLCRNSMVHSTYSAQQNYFEI